MVPSKQFQVHFQVHHSMSSVSKTKSKSVTQACAWGCRSCGVRRVKTWCQNKACEEYAGPLNPCGVPGCDFPTPHVLCRTHYTKGLHCLTCARKLNKEGFCTKCDILLECVVDDCKGHARFLNDSSIPLCREHFGTRICFVHLGTLDHGICPLCPDSLACVVDECGHPTVKGRPLCQPHYQGGLHCLCGMPLNGLEQAITFCTECDEHWYCKTKGCNTLIAQFSYCKACHKGRTAYLA